MLTIIFFQYFELEDVSPICKIVCYTLKMFYQDIGAAFVDKEAMDESDGKEGEDEEEE
jgi:hypothetical protein